jgi:prepilin-type N-terminal cleavage/methylation domain-containing protein
MVLTHPNQVRPRRSASGLTLLEMLVALSIASLVFAALGTLAVFTARGFVATGNYADLDRASRNALDVITRDIRESRSVAIFSNTKMTLVNYSNQLLVLEWKPSTGQMTRTLNGTTTVLLTGCDFLSFSNYIRVPTNGWQWYPVSSNTNIASPTKLVDVSWKCSRQILGKKINTESVQTAKIVIRN